MERSMPPIFGAPLPVGRGKLSSAHSLRGGSQSPLSSQSISSRSDHPKTSALRPDAPDTVDASSAPVRSSSMYRSSTPRERAGDSPEDRWHAYTQQKVRARQIQEEAVQEKNRKQ